MKPNKHNKKPRFIASGLISALVVSSTLPNISCMTPKVQAAGETLAFQWAESGGGAYTDAYHDVEYTQDGGFVVMGYTMGDSTSPEWTYHKASGHTNNDAVLVKYSADRQVEWAKTYGYSSGVTVFNDITILKNGNIAAIGRSSFTSSDNKIKGVAWYVLIIDSTTGEQIKEYRIGGSAGDQGLGIAATEDGGFVVGGWSASKEGYLTSSTDGGTTYAETIQLWQAKDGTDATLPKRLYDSGSDSVIVKINQEGEVDFCSLHNYAVMHNKFNVTSPSERLEGLMVDKDQNIILTGFNSVAKEIQNAVIAKYDGVTGTLLWDRTAGSKDDIAPEDSADFIKATYSSVDVLSDGSYVAVGTSTNDATTEEGWRCTATKDTIVVHYDSDGTFLHAESFGRVGDNASRPEGVTAAQDGGYYVYGSQSGVLYEDELLQKGYDWGNYGAQDAILIKYDKNDRVEWSENYGTTNGDWFNGMAVNEAGQMVVVGESNGRGGYPSYGNYGGIDGIVLVSDGSSTGGASSGTVTDGAVTWADGTYTASGIGYSEKGVSVELTISGNQISNVLLTNHGETEGYYHRAKSLADIIVAKQTSEVDAISGATMSSNAIREGTRNALSMAAAANVDALITAISSAGSEDAKRSATQTAADAYAQLGSYSLSVLTQKDTLQTACDTYHISLTEKSGAVGITETTPQMASSGLPYDDTYYKLQQQYYQDIHATALADAGLTGEGVKIAVIDSGVTGSHEDIDYERILTGYDYINDTPYTNHNFIDTNGHGTAVTGILAAKAGNHLGVAGLLNQVEIVPLRVNPTKEKTEADSQQVARAIKDAVDTYGVDVITTSLDVIDTTELKEAVEYAESKGVIITGASGNSSTEDSTGNDPYLYPASYDSVISVGAVNKYNQVRTTSQKNDQVFVSAPGENIVLLDVSRGKRCKISSGTSYASPVVAAMAVAAKQSRKSITTEQFKTLLKTSSVDAGESGYDTSYGWGIVDFQAFVKQLQNFQEQFLLSNASITLETIQQKPSVTEVKIQQNTLTSGTDYQVSDKELTGQVSNSAAAIEISGMGQYTGTKEIRYAVGKTGAESEKKTENTQKESISTTYKDGTYTGTGTGFGGNIILQTTIQNDKITDIVVISQNETAAYYSQGVTIIDRIKAANSAEVDTVSGATLSSTGIRSAVQSCLSQAKAAQETAKTAEETNTVIDYNDFYYPQQMSSMEVSNPFGLAEQRLTGKGITIAIIDSGLAAGHEDFDYTKMKSGWDYIKDTEMTENTLMDTNGHGTAMAGILQAQTGNAKGMAGLLSEVSLVPLRVDLTNLSQTTSAIRDAVDKYKADILLIGGSSVESEELKAAVSYAAKAGAILISSAEENGDYPAAYSDVISVGGVRKNGLFLYDAGIHVDVLAPAEDLVTLASAASQYTVSSDPAYASAIVAAMAAAGKQGRPALKKNTFLNLLKESGKKAGVESDCGMVDLAAFAKEILKKEVSTTTPNSTSTFIPANTPIEPATTTSKPSASAQPAASVQPSAPVASTAPNPEDNSAEKQEESKEEEGTSAEIGEVLQTEEAKGVEDFVVLSDDTEGIPEVSVGKIDENAEVVDIPDTITANGVTYAVTSIGKNTFQNNHTVKQVTIGKNITVIGSNAFENATALEKVTVQSKNLTTIGRGAFSGAISLKEITIQSKELESIGKGAFSGATSLKTVSLASKQLKQLSGSAFEGDISLESIDLSTKSLETIGKRSFAGTPNLRTLNISSTTLRSVGQGAFTGTNQQVFIGVKKISYEKMLKTIKDLENAFFHTI